MTADWRSVATLLTVPVGWLVVHLFARRAQKDHYHGQLILEAGKAVSDDLLRYMRWLLEHSKMIDQLHYVNGSPTQAELQRLSDHAALPVHMDWVLTSRGNERILTPVFPAIRFVTIRILNSSTEIRAPIEKGALNTREGAEAISSQLMEQSERVERFRDMLMASVKIAVFGKQRWKMFLARTFPRWYRRSIEVPARRTAVLILGEDLVQRGERERDRQEKIRREAGAAGRKEGDS